MRKPSLPAAAACFWGAVVFLPVGLNYLGVLLLLATFAFGGAWQERWTRLRGHPMWWPLVFLLLWQCVVLAVGPRYPETGQNFGHGMRIVLTVAMALLLNRQECLWALRGVVASAVGVVLYIGYIHAAGLIGWNAPTTRLLESVVTMVGNKSINNAIILSVLGAASVVWSMQALARQRWAGALARLLPAAIVLAIISTNLLSRTSLLALLVTLPALCLYQWRARWGTLAAALTAVMLIISVAAWLVPDHAVERTELGLQEIAAARAGDVSHGSWAVRYHMYEQTLGMIADRPLAGWGIGAWNSEWKRRAPAELAGYNMPHNDYLWMGAQTGVPGSLALAALLLAGLWAAWKQRTPTGCAAFGAMLILILAAAANSALRDAQIGLSLLWVAMLMLRASAEPHSPWAQLLPWRDTGNEPPATDARALQAG